MVVDPVFLMGEEAAFPSILTAPGEPVWLSTASPLIPG